ncbi:MAG: hypothetical protein WCK09_17400 [Bacteroidota bacterium]
MQQHYKFKPSAFNADGVNRKDGTFILELVRKWEQNFHDRFSPFYANYLYANYSTMRLIQNCIAIGDQKNRGIEAYQGPVYIGKSYKSEKVVIRPYTIHAIGSKFDVDVPIWFGRDHTIADGLAILTHDSDSDDNTDNEGEYVYDKNPIIHADAKRIKVR